MSLTKTASTAIHVITYTAIRNAVIGDVNMDDYDLMYFIESFEEATEEERIEAYKTIFTEMNESSAFEIESYDDLLTHLHSLSHTYDTYDSMDIENSLFFKLYERAGLDVLSSNKQNSDQEKETLS